MLFSKLKNIKWIFSAFGFYILCSCSSDTTNPSNLSSVPQLDISIYQGDYETPIGTNVRFSGYLISAAKDTLDKEKVYFSSYPDSLGNMTPIGGAYTDVNNPAGFRENVIFTGRKEGIATILGVYRDSQGSRIAADSIEVKVIGSING